jgi:hypothetical protein
LLACVLRAVQTIQVVQFQGSVRAFGDIRLCGTDFLRFDAGDVARDQSRGGTGEGESAVDAATWLA